jgi:hypothetical protein
LILHGTLREYRENGDKDAAYVEVAETLKAPRALARRRVLQLSREVPVDYLEKPMLLFCGVSGEDVKPYVGLPATPELVAYVKGLVAIDANDRPALLRYCFAFLDHPNEDVAVDALLEFSLTDDRQLARLAVVLPPARLRAWLRRPGLTAQQMHVYGLMLGYCGDRDDAAFLRRLVLPHLERGDPGIDGVLIGQALLDPGEGWAFLRKLAGDGKSAFVVRYATLRAARYIHDVRPEAASRRDLAGVLALLLEQPDIADLPVDCLRKWGWWDFAPRVLPLYGAAPFDNPVTRRAVLRYALRCPGAEARALVKAVRAKDPETFADVEEMLKSEMVQATSP